MNVYVNDNELSRNLLLPPVPGAEPKGAFVDVITRENLEALKGKKVRVVKSFYLGGRTVESRTEGKIVSTDEITVGSSFTPGRNNRFWVTKFILEKPDGELSAFTIDDSTIVEELES